LSDSIRLLVVDDIAETRDHIAKLISFEPDIELVGTAAGGLEALDVAARVQPDVVLMDVNMPGMDGIETSERLARNVPGAVVVMMSVQNEAEYLRRSMLAGAREFLVKPFTSDELFSSVRQVSSRQRESRLQRVPVGPGVTSDGAGRPERRGRLVSVFSSKGGVGRTTLAANLAVAAATNLRQTVVLIDANFQFGDVGLLLNVHPTNTASIADVLAELAEGHVDAVDPALITHASGVKVLLPPPSPEMAELVTSDHMRRILARLRQRHDLVIVDCFSQLGDPTLGILDASDVVLTVLTFDLTSIKNTRVFLGVAERLGYGEDKIKIVLNKADSAHGITLADVENSIGRKVDFTVSSDARTVTHALNNGAPFVSANANAQISRDVAAIARAIAAPVAVAAVDQALTQPPARVSRQAIFARR
jgi:pilus assembly protein CpaE